MCSTNLFVMHYYILHNCPMDAVLDLTSFFDNFLGITFDVAILFLVFFLITWKSLRMSLILCYATTWFWSLSNVFYSRFFNHYLTFSAIGQGDALLDPVVLKSIFAAIRIEDFYYFFSFFFLFYILKVQLHINHNHISSTLKTLIIIFLVDVGAHFIYCACYSQYRYFSYFIHRMNVRLFDMSVFSSQPVYTNFIRGSIRVNVPEVVTDLCGKTELTQEQMECIDKMITANRVTLTYDKRSLSQKNLIFILVESYMSFTSDVTVNNLEVTPFLNSLKHDSTVYFNGRMKENVTIGESSDGQFIYMTGLLPLRSQVTVSKAKRVSLPGLPKIVNRNSCMIIPTGASMWNQDEMCYQYGFDELFTSKDYEYGQYVTLNDEQVFRYAIQKTPKQQPFILVILTMTMHQPYTELVDSTFLIDNSSMSKELVCYLNACHYTDCQVGKYFDYLKRAGLYDNSIIVIAADHPVHNTDFGVADKYIPLYIVNSGLQPKNMWQGECNQVDVYTTLLDLLGCNADWYGLGHSLVSPEYKNSVSDRTWDVSEWIILGDYFSKK